MTKLVQVHHTLQGPDTDRRGVGGLWWEVVIWGEYFSMETAVRAHGYDKAIRKVRRHLLRHATDPLEFKVIGRAPSPYRMFGHRSGGIS